MRLFNLNVGLIIHTLSALISGVGVAMFVCFLVALGYGEGDAEAHLVAALLTIITGVVAFNVTKKYPGEITHREGICIVAICWFILGPLGSLSFYFYGHHTFNFIPERAAISAYALPTNQAVHGHCDLPDSGGDGSEFCSYTNCLFEAISGMTTTGSSILGGKSLWQEDTRTKVTEIPHGIQLWRHLMHFMGGLGIIILSIAIMPLLGVGGMQLFKVEVAGPTADKLTPKIAATARMLWSLYVVLTIIAIILITIAGVPFFTALCFCFSAISTGGFGPLASSAGGLHNLIAELILGAVMLISSISFTLHYMFLNKKYDCYYKDLQTRCYIALILLATAIVTNTLLLNVPGEKFFSALHTALFQVISIISTTALSTADYGTWDQVHPLMAAVLITLALIGGCAGSTAGGPKVIRVVIAAKLGLREIFRLVHPKTVALIKVGGKAVDQGILDGIFGFFTLFIGCSVLGIFAISAFGYDLTTSFTSVIAHIGNIGCSFGLAGSTGSYNFMCTGGKWVLIFLMAIGRLELYNFLVLFSKAFWEK